MILVPVADKVLALYYQTDGATYVEKDDYKSESTVSSLFASGQAAMASLCPEKPEAGDVRNMSQEYGVVPIPKFSEAQTTDYSQMSDHVNLFCFPNTVDADRADMRSAVLEAMCSTSYHILRPVYYETVLRTQVVKDPQSSAMMEIIINNLRMDAGFVYAHSMGSFHQGFQHLVERGQNDAVSRYKKMTSVAQRSLGALAKQFERLVAEQE